MHLSLCDSFASNPRAYFDNYRHIIYDNYRYIIYDNYRYIIYDNYRYIIYVTFDKHVLALFVAEI